MSTAAKTGIVEDRLQVRENRNNIRKALCGVRRRTALWKTGQFLPVLRYWCKMLAFQSSL